jgi:hypothetical protein
MRMRLQLAIMLDKIAAVRPPLLPRNVQLRLLWKYLHTLKRWLFIGHPEAGWRSAVIHSIIVSCRRRRINPQDYLADVLRRLPVQKINQIDDLLLENWKPPSSDIG